MVEEDSPIIDILQCDDDTSILSYMGAEGSQDQKIHPPEKSNLLNESTIDITIGAPQEHHILKI
ncbi:hypothetical protein KI387_039380, partial [Taxus chinensis]